MKKLVLSYKLLPFYFSSIPLWLFGLGLEVVKVGNQNDHTFGNQNDHTFSKI